MVGQGRFEQRREVFLGGIRSGGRRSEVFVKFQKIFFFWGGGGQGRCEWRSEVFVKISCCFFVGGCQVGGTEK